MSGFVDMKKMLDAYGFGIIQDCSGLLKALEKNHFSIKDFLSFTKEEKKTGREELTGRQGKAPTVETKKETRVSFLRPGETAKMLGVVCSDCSGEIYVEGLCHKNPLVKKGFVRKGICGACGNEFGIR